MQKFLFSFVLLFWVIRIFLFILQSFRISGTLHEDCMGV